MKVYIEKFSGDFNKLGGKALFCSRLGLSLISKGIVVTGDSKVPVDLSINVVQLKHKRSRIKLLRLNGVNFNIRDDYQKKNRKISESLHKADGVVYQSGFAKRMCDRHLGVFEGPSGIIFNGSDPNFYREAVPAKVEQENVFLAVSRWRIHKQLSGTINSFLLADVKDSVLYVAGDVRMAGIDVQKYLNNPKIKFLGVVNQMILASYLKVATALIHISWFDACPNSVVEALVANVPVICGNVGGTREIVEPSGGYVCDIYQPYNLELVDVYNPPLIDKEKVAEAIVDCAANRPRVENNHVMIENIASQYLSFMKKLVGG